MLADALRLVPLHDALVGERPPGYYYQETDSHGMPKTSGMAIEPVDAFTFLGPVVSTLLNALSLDGIPDLDLDLGEDPFAGAFLDDPPDEEEEIAYREPVSTTRYQLRIDLDYTQPPVWRRITIPADASFFDLHVAIQDAMGWGDEHLDAFDVRKGRKRIFTIDWSSEDAVPVAFGSEQELEAMHEAATTLEELVRRGFRKFHYTYDFGDDWAHTIKVEKTLKTDTMNPLPEIVTGKGACPPEDCGGLGGYYAILSGEAAFIEEFDPEFVQSVREAEFDPAKVKFTPGSKAFEFHQMRQSW